MAISFDETNDYYSISDDAGLTLQDGDWIVAFWSRITDLTGSVSQYAISNNGFGANSSINIFINENSASDNGKWKFRVVDDDGTDTGSVAATNATGESATWTLVVVQHRTTDSEIQMWLCEFGGTASKEINESDASFNAVNGGAWNLARRVDGDADRYYGNEIGEFFKGDFSLSQAEIEALAQGLPIWALGKSPDVYLPMWTAEATLVDLFGSNDATRNDSPTTVEHAPVRPPTGPVWVRSSPSVSTSGSVAPTGGLIQKVKSILAGSITATGALANSLLSFVTIAGSVTPTGAVSTIVQFGQLTEGHVTPTGAISFVVKTSMAGSVTPTGDLGTDSVTTISAPVSVKNLMYIEQVKFTEPYSLQLVGGDDDRLSTFLAQRGVKDTETLVEELRTQFHSKDRKITTKGGTSVDDIVDNIYPLTEEGGIVPVGGVIFWPCDAGTIPLGWQVYTPAQGKFLVGADGVDFVCGVDGGALTYDISHTHGPGTLATDSDNHSHGPGTLDTDSDSHSHTSGTLDTANDTHSHTSGTLATDSDNHSHGPGTLTPTNGPSQTTSVDDNGDGVLLAVATQVHTHSLTGLTASDSHSHSVNSGSTDGDTHDHAVNAGSTAGDTHDHLVNAGTTAADSHSHAVDSGVTASGGSAVQSILPPYHVGTWIQFVGTV